LAFGVYPISLNQVYAMPESNLVGGNISEVALFYRSGCDIKKGMLNAKYNSIIYYKGRIDCDFLKEIYSKNGIYLYSMK
jgi:hypothetical protein